MGYKSKAAQRLESLISLRERIKELIRGLDAEIENKVNVCSVKYTQIIRKQLLEKLKRVNVTIKRERGTKNLSGVGSNDFTKISIPGGTQGTGRKKQS